MNKLRNDTYKDFDSSVDKIKAILNEKFIINNDEETILSMLEGLGVSLNNNVGFLSQDSKLVMNMKRIGFLYIQDMIEALILCAIRDIKGKPRELEQLIKKYRLYREEEIMNNALK